MRRSLFVMGLSFAALRCSAPPNSLPAHCEAIEVDPSRELVIVDENALADPSFAFTNVMGAVLGPNANAGARTWMDSWSAMPGEETLVADVIEPWSNGDGTSLDLARAPFELVAITNRVDFWTMGQGHTGELRFVYGLVTSGTRQPLTVIVELQLPPTRSPTDWARAWHALGTLDGDAYRAALVEIASEVLAEPRGQVRAQDARISPPRLAEFDVAPGTSLAVSNLVNTPSPSDDPAALASFVQSHQAEVLAGDEVLPQSMLTPFATVTIPTLDLPGVDDATTQALLSTTCSGCHTGKPTLDGTFHISPLRRGTDALSPFLTDSSHGPSELDRRAEILRGLLCQ